MKILTGTSFWYKPSERATRMAIFAGSVAVAGAFSGLIAAGVGFMNRKAGLTGWQWYVIMTSSAGCVINTIL